MYLESESPVDIHEQSPLNLAFVGDGVLELLVRRRLVCVKYVSAKGQSKALEVIEPMLTEAEQAVLRRGRNASKATVAKHATPQEYRASTGFEALLGWLFLTGQTARIEELFDALWAGFDPLEKPAE